MTVYLQNQAFPNGFQVSVPCFAMSTVVDMCVRNNWIQVSNIHEYSVGQHVLVGEGIGKSRGSIKILETRISSQRIYVDHIPSGTDIGDLLLSLGDFK